jgi:hypothetical protein
MDFQSGDYGILYFLSAIKRFHCQSLLVDVSVKFFELGNPANVGKL